MGSRDLLTDLMLRPSFTPSLLLHLSYIYQRLSISLSSSTISLKTYHSTVSLTLPSSLALWHPSQPIEHYTLHRSFLIVGAQWLDQSPNVNCSSVELMIEQ
jgi:hypothetical protein